MIDFVRHWSTASEIAACTFILRLGLARSKFYNWQERYGKANEHNGWVHRTPRKGRGAR